MKEELDLNQKFFIYTSEEDFDNQELELIKAAKAASKMAYAPYSGFHVGAALRLEDGSIVKGANQENAAYPEGSCAERVAFFKAATLEVNSKKIIKAAVVAFKDGELKAATPCGGCRQVMLEVEAMQKDHIELIMKVSDNKWVKTSSIKSLLPFSFEL